MFLLGFIALGYICEQNQEPTYKKNSIRIGSSLARKYKAWLKIFPGANNLAY